jgi:alkylation response protein AidB-like acyl-CoA dehydrogenase
LEFAWSQEQQRFREEVVKFAQRELNNDLIERDLDSAFSPQAWKECAAFGIQGLPVPEEYGGGEADALTVTLANISNNFAGLVPGQRRAHRLVLGSNAVVA